MNFAGFRAESKPLFFKLDLLNLEDTFQFETAYFMHDINNNNKNYNSNNIAPILYDLFQKTNIRHGDETLKISSPCLW